MSDQHRRRPSGDVFQSYMDHHDLWQADVARRTGLSTKHINQLATGRASFTPAIAARLQQAIGIDGAALVILSSLEGLALHLKRLDQKRIQEAGS